jgi:hypothetical protein
MPTTNPPLESDADPNLESLSIDETKARVFLERCESRVLQEERFKKLAAQWKQETKFMSNVTAKSMHIAYQRIIGMGPAALPLIIDDLEQNGPNHWFWALYVITDANPVSEQIAGNMKAMTEAWITWWKTVVCLPDSLQKMNGVSQPSV